MDEFPGVALAGIEADFMMRLLGSSPRGVKTERLPLRNGLSEGLKAYFAFCALIFAHRAFAARAIFALTAADIVLVAPDPLAPLACFNGATTLAPLFIAAMAL